MEVTHAQYAELQEKAERMELSFSNMLRRTLGLPLERQGVRKDLIEQEAKREARRLKRLERKKTLATA